MSKKELEKVASALAYQRTVGADNRIAELEKDKAYAEEQLDEQIQATLKLQKENAELKKELKDANEKVVHLACNQNKDLKYKLTKAKEILKMIVDYYPCYNKTITEQAEQFLEEIEK